MCLGLLRMLQQNATVWVAYRIWSSQFWRLASPRPRGRPILPGESFLPSFQMASFMLCPRVVQKQGSEVSSSS